MCLLRHLRGGSESSADSPNWLVGNGNVLPVILGQQFCSRCELLGAHIHGSSCLALFLLLSDCEHDLKSSIEGNLEFLGTKFFVLSCHFESLATLRMSNNDPLDSGVYKLCGTDLSSVSTELLVDTTVLRTHRDVITEPGQAKSEMNVRGTDCYLNISGDGTSIVESVHDFFDRAHGSITLPVTPDEVCSFAIGCWFTGRRTNRSLLLNLTDDLLGFLLSLIYESLKFIHCVVYVRWCAEV
mmetsp:Transcript_10690/g.15602  ORF Transcript_10690/g.15602 Transcript_10690/m.15602 type:complete len:241 (+) Transcript_10690:287-1009(+)